MFAIVLFATGALVGILSGFFGIGGGMLLVPILMMLHFNIKAAIAISVVQMFFSSILGSYLNYKKGNLKLNEGIFVGIGGALGAFFGVHLTNILEPKMLALLLLGLVVFAFFKVLLSKNSNTNEEKQVAIWILFLIGVFVGTISIMLGVGGAILLTPIMVGFLHYSTKKAATASLFFVVFSSVTGVVYKLSNGVFSNLALEPLTVLAVAIGALFGVVFGIKLKEVVHAKSHKIALLVMYALIIAMLVKKIFL